MDNQELLQDIRVIVQQETRKVVEDVVEQKLEQKLESKLSPIRKDIKKIRKDLEFAVGELDLNSNSLEKRVKKIEHHLGFAT